MRLSLEKGVGEEYIFVYIIIGKGDVQFLHLNGILKTSFPVIPLQQDVDILSLFSSNEEPEAYRIHQAKCLAQGHRAASQISGLLTSNAQFFSLFENKSPDTLHKRTYSTFREQ